MPSTNSTHARILDNITALALAQLITTAASFVSTAWVARSLGPEGYGIIGFGTAFVSYFSLLIILGTDVYGVREIAKFPDQSERLVSRILGLRFGLAVLALATYFFFIWFMDQSQTVKIVMIIQAIGPATVVIAVDFIFEGHQKMRPVAIRGAGTSLLALAAVLFFIRDSDDLFIAAAIPVLATAIGILWLTLLANKRLVPLQLSFQKNSLIKVARDCIPIAIGVFLSAIFFHVDIVMLGLLRSKFETGLYTGMARLLMVTFAFGHLVTTGFRPVLAAAFSKSSEMFLQYKSNVVAVVLLGFPIIAAVILFSKEIILLVFGLKFSGGVSTLIILHVAAIFYYSIIAASSALISWNDQIGHMWIYAMAAASNVILNLVLIPNYGIDGAAWATLISTLLMLIGFSSRLFFKFAIRVWHPIFLLLVCAIGAFSIAKLFFGFIAGWPLFLSLIGSTVLGTLLFFSFTILLRIVTLNNITKLFLNLIKLKT